METGPFQDPQKVSASDAFFEPFGATWLILGATWAQLGAKWRPKGPKMGPQIVQNRCQNRCRKSNEKINFVCQKMMRKLIKNRCPNRLERKKAILQKVLFFSWGKPYILRIQGSKILSKIAPKFKLEKIMLK